MRRNAFWGLCLLLVGGVLLLDNLGYLAFLGVSAWQLIWPVALIGMGIWILVGSKLRPNWESRDIIVPLESAAEAEIQLDYGAGELRIQSGAATSELLSGTFEGGVEHHVQREGSRTKVRIGSTPVVFGPLHWGPHYSRKWTVQLTDRIPIALTVKTGASDCRLDLEHLKVTALHLKSGASSTVVTLPANAGYTEVHGSSGAASVSLRIPEGVAARIQTRGGLSSTSVDQRRFPRQGATYISPNYETAENRVDIRLDMGVGSISIR